MAAWSVSSSWTKQPFAHTCVVGASMGIRVNVRKRSSHTQRERERERERKKLREDGYLSLSLPPSLSLSLSHTHTHTHSPLPPQAFDSGDVVLFFSLWKSFLPTEARGHTQVSSD